MGAILDEKAGQAAHADAAAPMKWARRDRRVHHPGCQDFTVGAHEFGVNLQS